MPFTLLVLALVTVFGLTVMPVVADDPWNPFLERDERPVRKQTAPAPPADARPVLPPMEGRFDPYRNRRDQTAVPENPPAGAYQPYQPPGVAPVGRPGTYAAPLPSNGTTAEAQSTVQRGSLPPVVSSDGRLPDGAWRGLDKAAAERLITSAPRPVSSPVLHDLWLRMLAEPTRDESLQNVRRGALLQSGQFAAAEKVGRKGAMDGKAPSAHGYFTARLDLVMGRNTAGCRRIKQAVASSKDLSKNMRAEAVVLAGYCAVVSGNRSGAALAAELARDAGYKRAFTIGLLDAIASGEPPRIPMPKSTTAVDGLLAGQLRNVRPGFHEAFFARAAPELLAFSAVDRALPPAARLRAAEKAAALNVISPRILANAYRSATPAGAAEDRPNKGPMARAAHFNAAASSDAQFTKTRAVRALLDSARRDRLYPSAARATSPLVAAMRPAEEIGWFAETAVEVLAAGAKYRQAREWVAFAARARTGQETLEHWLALLDIADPNLPPNARGRSLDWLENVARQGRFDSQILHRLAAVLDALNYDVPIPLWNLASRTPQPKEGHLPATGVLAELAAAAKAGHVARTVLYAVHTIGPGPASSAHIIALGDTVRALKRVGLETEARRLAFESLYLSWPRTSGS